MNKYTVKDRYSLPDLESCLHMRNGRYFSKIDLKSAFWQILVAPEDRVKTGFNVDNKVYVWRRMPFGLTNAPATMQRLIDRVLEGALGRYAYGYVDDIIVFSETIQDHLAHIADILARLKSFGLRIGLDKCEFFQEKIGFLGHVISHGIVQIDPEKIRAARDMPKPATKKDLQKVLIKEVEQG